MKQITAWSRRVVPAVVSTLLASSMFLSIGPVLFSGTVGTRDQPREVREPWRGKNSRLRLKPQGKFAQRKPFTMPVTKRAKHAQNLK